MTLSQTFMDDNHFFQPQSASFLGRVDFPNYPKGYETHFFYDIHLWIVALSAHFYLTPKWLSGETNIRPVIIGNNVRFTGLGLSQMEMSRIKEVSQGVIWKVLHRVRESSSLTHGLRGHILKTIIWKENHTLLRITRQKSFQSASKIRANAFQCKDSLSSKMDFNHENKMSLKPSDLFNG